MAEGLGQGGTLEKREGLKGVREREIQSRTFRFRPDPDVDFYCGPPLGPTPPPTPPPPTDVPGNIVGDVDMLAKRFCSFTMG